MHKTTLFAAAVAVSLLIGIDAWLSIRTLTPGVSAGSNFNPLITTTAGRGSPLPQYNDYLFVSD
jgi:hypothetical protein